MRKITRQKLENQNLMEMFVTGDLRPPTRAIIALIEIRRRGCLRGDE